MTPEQVLHEVTRPGPDLSPLTLVVLAHPDDEVLALGARMARHRGSVFVHVTDGSPADGADAASHGLAPGAYAAVRAEELRQALALGGAGQARRVSLGVRDQQAALHMGEIAERVRALLDELRPAAVLTHPYEGGHPDHDACAAAVHAAARAHAAWSEGPEGERPVLLEAAFYHQGPQGIETGCFLPGTHSTQPERTWQLSAAEAERKQALLACFATQQQTLQYFPCEQERFRLAPAYCFRTPPHAGKLFYEHYPWGITGAQFRALAAGLAEAAPCH